MIKHYRGFLIFLTACITSTVAAQSHTGLLDEITARFKDYVNAYPWEEIFVHSDRGVYCAGENIWFAIYSVDRQSLSPEGTSKIAYIEILNSENRQVAGKRIRLESGFGSGQVKLPDTVSSGNYTLRAYTNWMKNFMPDNCFSRPLMVFNAVSNREFTGTGSKMPMTAGQTGTESTTEGTGYIIESDNSGSENLVINIGTTRDLRNREGSLVYLFIETRGNINYTGTIDLTGNKTTVTLPKHLLTSGINHITVFNGTGKPVAERFILTMPVKRDSLDVISPGSVQLRNDVSAGFYDGRAVADTSDTAHLSVSIAPVTGDRFPGISNYLIFGSEYGRLPEELRISDLSALSASEAGTSLASLKDKWINWKNILSGPPPVIKYQKETDYHYIYGKLINQASGAADPGRYVLLSIPGKYATFQYAVSDRNGDFSLKVPIDKYFRDLILQPKDFDRKDVIRSESSFSEKYPAPLLLRDSSGGREQENIARMKVNYQVEKIYNAGDVTAVQNKPLFAASSRRFYGKPDVELKMDDYIKLPVMQEVFFELIPGATLKSRKSGYVMVVTDPVEFKPFESQPTLMVDGVIINDAAIIANLDPELVERVEVVRERYFVGDYLFHGLVNVITRAGNFSNATLPDYAVRITYRVIDPSDIFFSPDYSNETRKQSRNPDFRNTLYWNPSVKTDRNGKAQIEFWSSDFPTDYEIIVQGLSKGGKPFYARKILTVRK